MSVHDAELRIEPPEFGVRCRHAVHCSHRERAVLIQVERTEVRFAKAGRICQHTFKYRRKFTWRTRYDAQHLRRRRLLLQRFGELGRALAQFVEQPRVLDGDDRLSGEVLHQRDLFISKWAHLLTTDANTADSLLIAK